MSCAIRARPLCPGFNCTRSFQDFFDAASYDKVSWLYVFFSYSIITNRRHSDDRALHRLAVPAAVVRSDNFAIVGKALHMPQSEVRRVIARVEAPLRTSVGTRYPHRYTSSGEARRLYEQIVPNSRYSRFHLSFTKFTWPSRLPSPFVFSHFKLAFYVHFK